MRSYTYIIKDEKQSKSNKPMVNIYEEMCK